MEDPLRLSRLRLADLLWVAFRSSGRRRLRSVLSSLGIALGAGAIVAVLGVAGSSEAAILQEFDRLSTLLRASGSSLSGPVSLPVQGPLMAGRIGPVLGASGTADLAARAYRTDLVPVEQSNALRVIASDPGLLTPLGGSLVAGRFLNAASDQLPVTVLGSIAADRLGIDRVGPRIYVGGHWFLVIGLLAPVKGAPEIDDSVIVGLAAAQRYLGYSGGFSIIYVRTRPHWADRVAAVLPATIYPGNAADVSVAKASDILSLQALTQNSLGSLVLGLGGVALVIGGLGVANVMIVSVLERRTEIAIRRALGARRRHIALQFLCESVLMSAAGGALGVVCGLLTVTTFSSLKGWGISLPWYAIGAAVAASLVVGVSAGVYPSYRASSLAPSEILRSV